MIKIQSKIRFFFILSPAARDPHLCGFVLIIYLNLNYPLNYQITPLYMFVYPLNWIRTSAQP